MVVPLIVATYVIPSEPLKLIEFPSIEPVNISAFWYVDPQEARSPEVKFKLSEIMPYRKVPV